MDYPNWFSSPQEADDLRWPQRLPVNYIDHQSDTFQNVATTMPTSIRLCQALQPPHSHDRHATYERIFPTTNLSTNESSTPLPDHLAQDPIPQPHGHNAMNSDVGSSSLRTAPAVGRPRIQEGNPASHTGLSGSGELYTSEDIPNAGETVLRDDLKFVTLQPDGLGSAHVCRVSFVYWVLISGLSWHGCGSRCPKLRELWLQMIEGNDDGDEVWLWVDGDEKWIQHNLYTSSWLFWPKLEKEDWVAAQSALRRRMKRAQLSPRPVPKKTAGLALEDHARIRKATPAQRFTATHWLIHTSRRKEELDFQHGLSSRSNFALMQLTYWWHCHIRQLTPTTPFPEQPKAWIEFEEKRKAMGCECLHRGLIYRERLSEWVRMMKWLQPEWNLDVECIDPDYCNACKNRAKELWERLYGDDHSRDIPLLPIQLAFSLVVVHTFGECMEFDETSISFAETAASKSLSANAQRDADGRFWPLCSPGERNIEHPPWLNAYPKVMRRALVNLSGKVGPYARLHYLPPVEALRDEYLDELPVGFADDAPNLKALVGTIVWILACRFVDGPSNWHNVWVQAVDDLLQFKDILPLPELAGTQFELRNHLERLWLEDGPCFRYCDCLDDFWTIYAAIIMYVKSLNLGPKFEGCPECHAACLTIITGSGSGIETRLAQGSNDLQESDLTRPSPPRELVSSPFRPRSLSPLQEDDSTVPYLSPSLFDVSLPLDDRQHRFNARARELIARATIAGLRFPSEVLPIVIRSDTQPTIPTTSSSNIVEQDAMQVLTVVDASRISPATVRVLSVEDQTPAQMAHPNGVSTSRFNSAPNDDLKKRHKIARIKKILIDMLRGIDFPLHNRYLPWSTLEGDLQKHGYVIINWPSGVPRENDKGIHTLSAGHVNKLYLAFTQGRDEDCPRFVPHVDPSTDQNQGMASIPKVARSKRRLEIDHYDGRGKKTMFKVTTAEYYTSHSTKN